MKCDELEVMILEDGIGQMCKCYDVKEVDEAIAELKERCEAEKSIGATFSENCAELARWVEELRTEIESLKEAYKFDKWDLFFENDEINKCKGTFVLHVVDKSPTFESWIKDEHKNEVYTCGYFKCVWKEADDGND